MKLVLLHPTIPSKVQMFPESRLANVRYSSAFRYGLSFFCEPTKKFRAHLIEVGRTFSLRKSKRIWKITTIDYAIMSHPQVTTSAGTSTWSMPFRPAGSCLRIKRSREVSTVLVPKIGRKFPLPRKLGRSILESKRQISIRELIDNSRLYAEM